MALSREYLSSERGSQGKATCNREEECPVSLQAANVGKLTTVYFVVLPVHLRNVQGDEYFQVVWVSVGTIELRPPTASSHFVGSSWYDAIFLLAISLACYIPLVDSWV